MEYQNKQIQSFEKEEILKKVAILSDQRTSAINYIRDFANQICKTAKAEMSLFKTPEERVYFTKMVRTEFDCYLKLFVSKQIEGETQMFSLSDAQFGGGEIFVDEDINTPIQCATYRDCINFIHDVRTYFAPSVKMSLENIQTIKNFLETTS